MKGAEKGLCALHSFGSGWIYEKGEINGRVARELPKYWSCHSTGEEGTGRWGGLRLYCRGGRLTRAQTYKITVMRGTIQLIKL